MIDEFPSPEELEFLRKAIKAAREDVPPAPRPKAEGIKRVNCVTHWPKTCATSANRP